MFESMIFKCEKPECGEQFNLNGYLNHLKFCTMAPTSCAVVGDLDKNLGKDRKKPLEHTQKDCRKCQTTMKKYVFDDHDCLLNLIE